MDMLCTVRTLTICWHHRSSEANANSLKIFRWKRNKYNKINIFFQNEISKVTQHSESLLVKWLFISSFQESSIILNFIKIFQELWRIPIVSYLFVLVQVPV